MLVALLVTRVIISEHRMILRYILIEITSRISIIGLKKCKRSFCGVLVLATLNFLLYKGFFS